MTTQHTVESLMVTIEATNHAAMGYAQEDGSPQTARRFREEQAKVKAALSEVFDALAEVKAALSEVFDALAEAKVNAVNSQELWGEWENKARDLQSELAEAINHGDALGVELRKASDAIEALQSKCNEQAREIERLNAALLVREEVVMDFIDQRDTALSKIAAMESQKPVASIYITASGEREIDDWKCDLVAGRHELYLAPGAAPKENNHD